MKNNFTIYLILIISLYIFSCSDDDKVILETPEQINKVDTTNFEFSLTSIPSIGTSETKFKFILSEKNGNDTLLENTTFSFDLDGDGQFEKILDKLELDNVKFPNENLVNIIAKIEGSEKSFSCSTKIIIIKPKLYFQASKSFIHDPNIYNSKKIVLTTESDLAFDHSIQIMELDGSDKSCLFCDNSEVINSEMHNPNLSFDGKKVFWDTGMKEYYYNLETNSGKPILIVDFAFIPDGRIIWNNNSDKIYFIDNDKVGVNFKNISDLSTKSFIDVGEYLCPVPNKNQIAVISRVEDQIINSDTLESSDLYIYDENSAQLISEYKNIPGYGYFRIIDDGKKIFFNDNSTIYDLEKGKLHYLDFDTKEFPISTDIRMDGKQLIYSVFDENNRALYSVDIPIEEL